MSDLQLQDYSTVINNPMWLGSIADKLQQQLYQTVGQFVSDVELIFANFTSYNRVRNSIIKKRKKLKLICSRKFPQYSHNYGGSVVKNQKWMLLF